MILLCSEMILKLKEINEKFRARVNELQTIVDEKIDKIDKPKDNTNNK